MSFQILTKFNNRVEESYSFMQVVTREHSYLHVIKKNSFNLFGIQGEGNTDSFVVCWLSVTNMIGTSLNSFRWSLIMWSYRLCIIIYTSNMYGWGCQIFFMPTNNFLVLFKFTSLFNFVGKKYAYWCWATWRYQCCRVACLLTSNLDEFAFSTCAHQIMCLDFALYVHAY